MPNDKLEPINVDHLPKRVREFIAEARDQTGGDERLAALAMLDQILAADTAEGILAESEVTKMAEYENREFYVHSYRWQESDMADGIGFFMSLECSDTLEGDRFVMNSGSVTIMGQVFALNKADLLPVQVTLRKADRPTKSGYYPLHLSLVKGEFVTD